MEILYSSNELHDAITKVLADPEADDRRVALVAYIGGQAQAFLPNPQGLEIVCWLQPGSSDPLTIARLIDRGAKIYKSERMHMKVYWSSRNGCVICSANASGKALGGGIQKEAGVLLPPNTVDIQRLWDYAKPTLINKDIDLKHLSLEGERPPNHYANLTKEPPPDFLEWHKKLQIRDYPFQAVQANPPTSYRPPFKLDQAFRNAFRRAVKQFRVEKLDDLWCRRPPPKLWSALGAITSRIFQVLANPQVFCFEDIRKLEKYYVESFRLSIPPGPCVLDDAELKRGL